MAAEHSQLTERSWFRYCLGTMFLVVLGVAAWMAYRGVPPVRPVPPIVQVDQMDLLITNLSSNQTLAHRFAVGQCQKLGPAAAEALPALKALRARKQYDPAYVARIDAAIVAVEGGGDRAPTP